MALSARSLAVAVLATMALALSPAVASAQTYYAQAAGVVTGGCLTPGANCNLVSAIAQAHSAHVTGTPDTIVLDAGTHTTGGLTLADDGLTLRGQGVGATTIASTTSVPITVNPPFTSDEVTIRDLEVRNTNASANGTNGSASTVLVKLGHLTLDHADLFRSATTGFDSSGFVAALRLTGGSATVTGSHIDTAGPVNVATNSPLVVSDARLTRSAPSSQPVVSISRLSTTIARTLVDGGGGTGEGISVFTDSPNSATLYAQNVAIVRTGIGVLLTGSNSGADNLGVLEHVTIVPTSTAVPSVKASKNSVGITNQINVRDSILAGPPTYVNEVPYDAEQIRCTATALVDNPLFEDTVGADPYRACKPGSADRGNSAYVAGMASATDGSLPAGSPAIDAGTAGALPIFFNMAEPSVDLVGNPRVALGLCGATVPRRDLGAYERPIPLGVGTASITGPDTLVAGTAGTFGYTASGSVASSAWSDGAGGQSSLAAPSFAYAAAGSYTVSAVLTPADGCPVTVTRQVTVTAAPGGPSGPGDGGGNGGGGGGGGGNGGGGGGSVVATPTLKVSLAARATAKKPAKVSFTANVAGTVKATVTQKAKGYKKSKKAACGAVKKGKKANCTRTVKVAAATFTVKAGASTATLKLPKKLKSGTYTVSFVLAAGGKTSRAVAKSLSYKPK